MLSRLLIITKQYIFVSLAFSVLVFAIVFCAGRFMTLQLAMTTLTSIDYCTCVNCVRGTNGIPIYQRFGYSSPELCRVDADKTIVALREHPVEIWLWSLLPQSLRPSCETIDVCFLWDRETETGYTTFLFGMLLFSFVAGNMLLANIERLNSRNLLRR